MSLTPEQNKELHNLLDYRDKIVNSLFHIEIIIKQYFPEEFESAYQHWIPQIMTALYDDTKWLPRGRLTMQQTIDRLADKKTESDNK